MKQRSISFLFLCLSLAYLFLLGNSAGAPVKSTGAPGEATCGRSGCHGVVENVDAALLTIDYGTGEAVYMPNETYPISITLSNVQNESSNGFQIVALDSLNKNIGSWELIDTETTQILSGNSLEDRSYVTHTQQGTNQTSWTVNWKAPAEALGTITFYLAANAANADGGRTGDAVYFTNFSITAGTTTSVRENLAEQITIYPNPTSDYIYIDKPYLELTDARLYNAGGQLIQSILNPTKIDITSYIDGLYLLELRTAKGGTIKKILLQR